MNRRHFLFSLAALIPIFTFRNVLAEAAKAVVEDKEALKLPLISTTDPMAKALNYCDNANKGQKLCPARFSAEKNPATPSQGTLPGKKQYCHNCQFYSGVGKKGKEDAGKCQVLKPGQGLVTAKGWCNSWVFDPKKV